MFGWLKRKKKQVNFDSTYYPLDTCVNFLDYVTCNFEYTDAELTDKILRRTAKKVEWVDVLDLVKTTRDAIGYYTQVGNRAV